MKDAATQQQRVERRRSVAAFALEVLHGLDEPTLRERVRAQPIRDLVRVALQDYRLKYPACKASSAWLFYDGDPSTTKIKLDRAGKPVTGRVDVYCTFCRVILVNGANIDTDYTESLLSHTTICALQSLAGHLTPGAPGTYRMPGSV